MPVMIRPKSCKMRKIAEAVLKSKPIDSRPTTGHVMQGFENSIPQGYARDRSR